MLKQVKNDLIGELSEIYTENQIVLFTQYSNISVHEIDDLRIALRACGAKFKMVKNTLSKISFVRNNLKYDQAFFVGPTALAYSNDPIETIRVIFEFNKKNPKLKIVSALLDKNILQYEDLVRLSKVPSLDVIRAQILGALRTPGQRILMNLKFPLVKIVYLLKILSNKIKE